VSCRHHLRRWAFAGAVFVMCVGLLPAPALGFCRFQGGATTGTLAFGALTPGSGITGTANLVLRVRCAPASDLGLIAVSSLTSANGTGPGNYRMSNGGGSFITYGMSITFAPDPVTGAKGDGTANLTGTVAPASYDAAPVGSFSDTLTVVIGPP
jgi:hypothetical protein